MEAPTALFDSYEADFRQILDSVREKFDSAQEQGAGESSCQHSYSLHYYTLYHKPTDISTYLYPTITHFSTTVFELS